MRHIHLLLPAAMACLCSLPTRAAPGQDDTSPPRPAIVVYIADDHSVRDASAYGAPAYLQTPTISALAAAGMTFDNAHIASPACAPSRAALLTGLMPSRNGAEANHTHPRSKNMYLPRLLQTAGYQVSAFGKVAHNGTDTSMGFTFCKSVAKRGDLSGAVRNYYANVADKTRPQCIMLGDHRPHVAWIDSSIYHPDSVTLPRGFIDTRETREHWTRYLTDITGMDREMGRVYAWAQATFGTNLIFIYSADHGAQWPFSKWNLYAAGTRVPLLVTWPGQVTPGTRSGAQVSWIDILPTLFEILQIPCADTLDGMSFKNVLLGATARHRDCLYTTHSADGNRNIFPIRCVRNESFSYILNPFPQYYHSNHSDIDRLDGAGAYWHSWDSLACVDSSPAMIRYRYYVRPPEEFYVLQEDPDELYNRIGDAQYRQQIDSMRTLLRRWMAVQKDTVTIFGTPWPVIGPRPFNTDTIRPWPSAPTTVRAETIAKPVKSMVPEHRGRSIKVSGAAGPCRVRIIDLRGRMVYDRSFTAAGLIEPDAGIKTGFYLLRIQSGTHTVHQRIFLH